MTAETMPFKKNHHGRNVRRLREMLGVKQETIAIALDMTQQNLSALEQKEEIEDKVLDRIAQALNVSVAAIKNMNEEATINYINTFNDSSGQGCFANSSTLTFNPIDKIVELYERMLKVEQEKVALWESFKKEEK
ncbi:helix-turn-helix domain-containing protein [Flavobacterium sp. '19STA2R22 D10 B1']|uniref:helix-turn-helix domain-containing protein n=1 Tax=Flavobacterium aerium TaxID=3037261 RepID=UPI00278BCF02|nr:helix-turn-helix transcriptional regulator [Flavobacterium sp. '19STA2R22 D10 B1']